MSMPASAFPIERAELLPLSRPIRVLVVDDHKDAADSLAEVLRLYGADVEACRDGPTALTRAGRHCPDVCVLDLMMPGMDGDEVASRLRDVVGGHPVVLVAVTARCDDEARDRTRAAGFDLHMVKPIDPRDLLAFLADVDWWLGDTPRPAA